MHQHDEVVGEANKSIVRQPVAASLPTLPLGRHVGVPPISEMLIEHRQIDVGQPQARRPLLAACL